MSKSSPHKIKIVIICATLLSTGAYAQRAGAQQPKEGDGVTRFEQVTVQRITPDQLPQGQLNEDPRRVIRTPKTLPRPATEQDLKRLDVILRPRVVEIIAEQLPPQPYRQVPMLYHGHAVLVSAKADGSDPVLISTYDWLQSAQSIYMVPPQLSAANATQDKRATSAPIVSLNAMSADKAQERFKRERDKYIPLKLERPDKWRNLTGLSGFKDLPATGLKLLDLEHTAVGYLYGFSPLEMGGPVPTTMIQQAPKEEALAYYWQTTLNAVLGAPLVDGDGELVILNAMRHPSQPGISLAIPPKALRHHVRALQGITEPAPEAKAQDATQASPQ